MKTIVIVTLGNFKRKVSATLTPPFLFVGVVYSLLCLRILFLISYHSVNILFWDEWDFYTPIFENRSLWELFFWQHGPHRQGIGLVLTKFVASLTRWDTRADSYAIAATVMAACFAALLLKKRLFSSIEFEDALIPLIFFTTSQVETFVGVPNLSHAAAPLLLIILFCLAWTHINPAQRYLSILILICLLVFTGFGIFMGPIAIVLLSLNCYKAAQCENRVNLILASIVLIASILTTLGFFVGYIFDPAVACFHFPIPNYGDYFWFVCLMFAGFCGLGINFLKNHQEFFFIIVLLTLGSVWVPCRHAVIVLKGNLKATPKSIVIIILIGYSLLFCLNTAFGRICLGLGAAQFSRYMTLLIPAFLGLYFCLLGISNMWIRRLALLSLLVLLLPGYFPLDVKENYIANYYRSIKCNWKQCYLENGEIERCDQLTGFKICPDAVKSKLQQKLDYLRTNKLNLFVRSK